jgi:arylsulfatase B/arylsulfatase I/J
MASWAYTPTYRGFLTHFGFYNGATDYWAHTHPEKSPSSPLDMHWGSAPHIPASPVTDRNGSLTKNVSDYGAFLFARQTNAVIDAHVARAASSPLFLYLTHQSVHEPLQAPAEYIARFPHVADASRRIFCGMLAALDDAVHDVTSHMQALSIWDNTLFVFHADVCAIRLSWCRKIVTSHY